MYDNIKINVLSFVLLFCTIYCAAQSYTLKPIFNEVATTENLEKFLEKTAQSKEEVKTHSASFLNTLYNLGYFAASVDSISYKSDTAFVYAFTGNKFEKLKVNWKGFSKELSFLRNYSNESENLELQSFTSKTEKILELSQQNGYPFANIKLDNFDLSREKISLNANYKPGRYYTIDSLITRIPLKLKSEFLNKYLGIKSGDVFNQSQIDKIDSKLKGLPFLQTSKKPAVEFFENGAKIYLFVKERKVNKFDLLLGLLPNSNANSALKIVGQANLELNNALKYGEKLKLVYNGYSESNKDFEVAADFLYLPNLSFGADAFFKLYINDTTFLERNLGLGISYPLFENSFFKVNFSQKAAQLLAINENQIINSKTLPSNIDYKFNAFGFTYRWQNLDDFYNPRNGFSTDLVVEFGFRNVSKNFNILDLKDPNNPNFNFETLYDSVQLNSNNLNIKLKAEKYFPSGKSGTILTKINGAFLTGQNLFNNQKYRIGGFNNLRGFDEQSILTDKYAIAVLEYRFILQGNSYFSAFSDAGFLIESEQKGVQNLDLYNAFGIGLNFETKNGIFGLQYAFGKLPENNFDFRAGKVHFGYLNIF